MTAIFPLGILRSFEPTSGPRAEWFISGLGLALLALVASAGAAYSGLRRTRPHSRVGPVGGLARLFASSNMGLALPTAYRMLGSHPTSGRRSRSLFAAGALGVAGVVASTVVGLSLTSVRDHPYRWGRNYDALWGNPYIAAVEDLVTPIAAQADVAEVTGATIGSLTINGSEVSTYAFQTRRGGLEPTTISGRAPTTIDEIGVEPRAPVSFACTSATTL